MRTGACTVQQALTSEAASVLKHALSLARRRGHAQVTPLHVAATLLSSTREATSLFRRACLRSHPHHRTAHPLQCRALELCFNVALNRLPTTPPPSSGPLIPTTPSLSNALIAALKRAQAHQRRGCIEQQQQQQPQQQPPPQQQQPLLAIKVELEQLVISILDDPSVSRVMREAGFSSTCVKKNLEEDSSSPSSVFFDAYHHRDIVTPSSFWQTYFLRPPVEPNPLVPPISPSSQKEDLRLMLQVLLGKNKRRSNAVVVGDSVSYAEGLVAELMTMVQRGEVPDELRSVQFVKFQLSSSNLRLMKRGEVDMTISDLRRKVGSLASGRGGVIIYVSDLKWAVDEEAKDAEDTQGSGYRAVDHVVAEVGRLLSELKGFSHGDVSSCSGNSGSRVWLMATANYQTYMRCKVIQPSLESQWTLQPVSVPSGGLALSLHAQSGRDVRMTTISQSPLHMEPKHFNQNDEHDKLICCAECTASFEREASMFKTDHSAATALQFRSSEAKDGSSNLPSWLQPHRPDSHQKDLLVELRKKWSRLCQSLRHDRRTQTHLYPPLFNRTPAGKSFTHGTSHPWWPSSNSTDSNPIPFSDLWPKPNGGSTNFLAQLRSGNVTCHQREATKLSLSDVSLDSLKRTASQEASTALALGRALFWDSAASADQKKEEPVELFGLWRRLEESIPWQPEVARSVAEALLKQRSDPKKGAWLLLRGTDGVGKRRLAQAIAESLCVPVDRFVQINARKSLPKSHSELVMDALKEDGDCIVSIEDIDWADASLLEFLTEVFENGNLEDSTGRVVSSSRAIFVLATGSHNKCGNAVGSGPDTVIKLRLKVEEASTDAVKFQDLKRKAESDSPTPRKPKNQRTGENVLDLNVSAEELDDGGDEEVDGNVPSDLTQETDSRDRWVPEGFLRTIGAHFVMDACTDRARRTSDHFRSKLHQSFDEAGRGGGTGGIRSFSVDQAAAAALAAASGSDEVFDAWLREVFQRCLQTVRKGGEVALRVVGKEGNVADAGFQGSALPRRIPVE